MAKQKNTVWDPFFEEVSPKRDVVSKPVARIKIPAFLYTVLILLALLSAGLGIYFFANGAENYGLIGFAIFSFCVVLVLVGSTLEKANQFNQWLLSTIAEKNDWSFHLAKEPVERRETNTVSDRVDSATDAAETGFNALASMDFSRENIEKFAQQSSGVQKREVHLVRDELVEPAYDQIGILLKASIAQPISLEIGALYWGETKQDIPFWMGVAVGSTDMTFATQALKTDARGNTNNQGNMLQIVTAYQLNRKTNIHAWLTAETFGRDSRKDLKTESVEFNDCFKISIRATSEKQSADGELELMRVLTPATQATLIDLRKRYKVQLIVEDDVIYISGYDLINIENIEEVAEIANLAAEEFAEAAVSFKHYAE